MWVKQGLEAHLLKKKKKLFWANAINTMVTAGQKCIYSVCMCVFMEPLVMLHMFSWEGLWKGGVCVCVCVGRVRLSVYSRAWGEEINWPQWLVSHVRKIRAPHTCATMEGPVMDGQRPDTIGRESEQPVHTSRVTWTMALGHKEVSLPYACFMKGGGRSSESTGHPDPTALSLECRFFFNTEALMSVWVWYLSFVFVSYMYFRLYTLI